MALSTTITTSAIATAQIVLNPVAKSTTVVLTSSTANTTAGSSNATLQIEQSLDDPSLYGGPSQTWALLSSAAAMNSSSVSPLAYTVLSPLGAVRVSIIAASTAAATFYSFTLKALQSVTA